MGAEDRMGSAFAAADKAVPLTENFSFFSRSPRPRPHPHPRPRPAASPSRHPPAAWSGPFGIPFWSSISFPFTFTFTFTFTFSFTFRIWIWIWIWTWTWSWTWFREGFPFFFSFFFSYFFFFFLFSLLFLFGSFSFRLVSLSFFLFLFLFLSFFLCAPIIPQKRPEIKQKVCSIYDRSVNFNRCSAVLRLISGNACGKPSAALWKTCRCRIVVSKILI